MSATRYYRENEYKKENGILDINPAESCLMILIDINSENFYNGEIFYPRCKKTERLKFKGSVTHDNLAAN